MALVLDVDNAPELGTELANGVACDAVVAEARKGGPEWIAVKGALANVLVDLAQRPGASLVTVGNEKGPIPHPLYLARAANSGSIYPAVCGFHLNAARINEVGLEVIAPTYEVLVGPSDEFEWKTPREVDRQNLVKASFLQTGRSLVETRVVSRFRVEGSFIYGTATTLGDDHYSILTGDSIVGLECEILQVRSKQPQGSKSADVIGVVTGRFTTDHEWTQAKAGDRYSTAIHIESALKFVPRIITGFDRLDISRHDSAVRLRLYPQNVMKENFILNAETWGSTCLYYCCTTWAAITEPGWQCGVLKMGRGGSAWSNRVNFSPAFLSPPMVFVCLCGLDMVGDYNVRVLATSVDHEGFNISIINSRDTKVGVTSVSWIAIPWTDVLPRKNAWIGRFSTDGLSPKAGKNSEWEGSVNFGFQFKRNPKVFLGVDHFDFDNARNVRLGVSVSGTSTSGMDWRVYTYSDSVLKGAGVSFLAVDAI